MSTDNKRFNSKVPSYEEIERQIRRARALRSEVLARGVQRLSAAVAGGSRRLLTRIDRALPPGGSNVPGIVHLGWVPAAGIRGGRPARCK